MFEYEILRLIWWALIGVLLIGFAVTDGFDMGVGALVPVIGKTDNERRVMINSIAPHWDGNQVWLITAGGALFAAWPLVYAVSFSGFYLAMILTLAALWLRQLVSTTVRKLKTRAGVKPGTGEFSLVVSFHLLFSVWRSVIYFKVYRLS